MALGPRADKGLVKCVDNGDLKGFSRLVPHRVTPALWPREKDRASLPVDGNFCNVFYITNRQLNQQPTPESGAERLAGSDAGRAALILLQEMRRVEARA